ncbi:hypothetical protein SAMN05192550_0077 [Flavobacterium glycines]|uniref:Uncharacterized protein n=1 Tax=Flavobacterium glycines TaxID=551990 RepID=A0A1B9DMX9_9FLAO|nr:hypothetical protein [Flavobacterium glycines]OCB71054.1 hypothetical protein FBGL_11435 [Flavobacterium glycines]GEL10870.1 hypothetical protein FGL01_16090 [Flavobacterium glycines]SDI50735.1 hypothetical protein SAMN05192550_0077 [Flavobacterium glycines]
MKTILFFLITISCFGQNKKLTDKQYNESGAAKIEFCQTVEDAEKLARIDLAKTPFVLVQGGIAPIAYPINNEFSNSCGVYYYELGCTGPERKISAAYNNIVFKHLCDTYGKKWKKTIRKDAIGLKEFKKKNGC